MEEILDYSKEQQTTINKHRFYDILEAIISSFISLFTCGFAFYLAIKGTFWFYPIAIYFLIESAFIIITLFIKDAYKAMRLLGIFQIVNTIILMSYLLFMILWNDPNCKMDYSFYTYLTFGGALFFKALLAAFNHLLINKQYHPLLHAYRNNDLITAFYLLLIIELILANQFYPGTNEAIFDNLLREKPFWIYLIGILLNATLTTLAALLALSTDIKAKTQEQLTTVGKIKHTVHWFNQNEVSMFFALIFTFYLAILSLINMKQSFFYILLFIYYMGTITIRLINYLWHKKIQKRCGDNIIKENRLSSWILLFDAGAYLVFSDVLVIGAIFMMLQRANVGSNIYLFLFMIVPMAVMRLITTNKSIKDNRRGNNTYRLGVSLISLISLFFTILEIVAISCHALPIVWMRYILIITTAIAAKIAVIVVTVIFVIHWFRSMILNNKRKEKRYHS